MATPLPKHPNLQGAYQPIQFECDAPDLVVQGALPADLNGTFYRNGPNPQYAPRGDYHWFAGDGMIHAFHLENGRVSYKNRWVKTTKWELERAAGRGLFSGMNPLDTDPAVQGLTTNGLANTNIVWHAGKLLALEEAHAPFQLDPMSLDSIGPWTFGDTLTGPMTAHPKMDPETGEMIFFGYSVDGMLSNKMSYHVVNREGKLTTSAFFDAPYAAMVHDFIVTRDFVIFPIMPLTASLDRALQGKPPFAWEPEKRNKIGVMPRSGSVEAIRWFDGDPSYVFHPMNAFNVGNKITCDVSQYGVAPLFPNADGSRSDPALALAKLTRWHIDLDLPTDTYKVEQLDDVACEFGRLDERYSGLEYRYGYMLCTGASAAKPSSLNAITRVDHQTGQRQTLDLGEHMTPSEAVFVPSAHDAPEGAGYLLANVYDASIDKSHLLILDAENITAGPLATAQLDHRVPLGFHGNWRPAS